MNNAAIINSKNDYYACLNLFKNCDFFVSNYFTYIELVGRKVKYLYENVEYSSKEYENISKVSMSWFRDSKNKDIIAQDGISIGPIISRRVITAFANEYKNYICISKMVGNYDRIYISDKSDKSFIDIAKLYKTKITFFSGSKII